MEWRVGWRNHNVSVCIANILFVDINESSLIKVLTDEHEGKIEPAFLREINLVFGTGVVAFNGKHIVVRIRFIWTSFVEGWVGHFDVAFGIGLGLARNVIVTLRTNTDLGRYIGN